MEYNWLIEQLDYVPLINEKPNVVVNVHWRTFVDREKTRIAQVYGTKQITFQETDNFLSYEQLTEQIVIDWLKREFSSEDIAEIEQNLQNQIDAWETPKILFGLPWNKT
jgi:hypothetical protein